MPTVNPRVNVTVSEEQHAMLLELGSLQGRSAVSFLREMLDASTPMLREALAIWRMAAEQVEIQPEKLREAIRAALAEVEASKDQMDLLEHLAAVSPGVSNDHDQAEAGTAPSGAREDRQPPARSRRKHG